MAKKNKADFWRLVLCGGVGIFFGGIAWILAAMPGESVRWFGWGAAVFGLIVAIVGWAMERSARRSN